MAQVVNRNGFRYSELGWLSLRFRGLKRKESHMKSIPFARIRRDAAHTCAHIRKPRDRARSANPMITLHAGLPRAHDVPHVL